MFDRFVKTAAKRDPWYAHFLRRPWVASFAVIVLAIAVWLRHNAPTSHETPDRMVAEVESSTVLLARASSGSAADQLSELQGKVKRGIAAMHVFLAHYTSGTPSDDAAYDRARNTLDNLTRLEGKIKEWQESLAQAPRDKQLESWDKIVLEILRERLHDPVAFTPQSTFSLAPPKRMLPHLLEGLQAGIVWPFDLVCRAFAQLPADMNRVWYAIFPYTQRAPPSVFWLIGFSVAAVVTGYGLCWLGVKSRWYYVADLGLVYLIYAIIFGLLVVSLHAGLL